LTLQTIFRPSIGNHTRKAPKSLYGLEIPVKLRQAENDWQIMKRTKGKKIAVFDTETDPFRRGRIPKPFCAAFYDGSVYIEFWGPDCLKRMWEEVRKLPDHYVIYAHNGGKFDFWHMLEEIDELRNLTIIHGRLCEFMLIDSEHLIRDSLKIIPIALSEYQKEVIDYSIFEKGERLKPANKTRISNYLKSDCINLLDIVTKFAERFGTDDGEIPISIGQAAIRELEAVCPFERMTEASDEEIRQWYLGGRNQCFEAGILKGPWKVYDVNSMYSYAMANYEHPLSDMWESLDRPPRSKSSVWFAEVEGSNRQALPVYRDGGIDFTCEHSRDAPGGVFYATSHELVPAIRAGLVTVENYRYIIKPTKAGNFRKYVDLHYSAKADAKRAGNRATELFEKFLLTTPYGKTGQNPREFKDYKILRNQFNDAKLRAKGFQPEQRILDEPFLEIWSRPTTSHGRGYYNVGIAASVTGAARAVLLEGLQWAVRPIYCDTDSVFCRDFTGPVDRYALGAWDHEATADYAAIAGKKLYCLFDKVRHPDRKYPEGKVDGIWPVKWASKGGDLSPGQIIEVAKGGEVEFVNEVPTYSLSRGVSFVTRNFRKTVDSPRKFK